MIIGNTDQTNDYDNNQQIISKVIVTIVMIIRS